MVIADTSVWITFQRDPRSAVGQELESLLAKDEVVMVGPVLAELLQGARSASEFELLRLHLCSLSFLETDQDASSDDRRAAELMARIDAESLEHARRFPETSPEDSHAALTAVE